MTPAPTDPLRVAVFASGSGTTFQALLDHTRSTPARWEIVLLVTDRERPGVVARAEAAGIPWLQIRDRDRDPSEVGAETLAVLAESAIDVVLLAGYLRLIPEAVVQQYEGRMLNTHPSLLPAFGGKGMYGRHVHAAVIQAGARVSGPTVQLVAAEYDRGLPLGQWPVPVLGDDDVDSLAARVQATERRLYPLVVDHLATSLLDNRPVTPIPHSGSAYSITSSPTDSNS